MNLAGPESRMRILQYKIAVPKLGVFGIGELLLVALYIGFSVWHLLWWQRDALIQAISNTRLESFARALGHTNQVTLAVLLLPTTRNSIWLPLFGIPFERAVRYHRWLGRILFMGVLAHMATWMGVWNGDDMLGACVLATSKCRHQPMNVLSGEVAFLSILVTAVTAYEAVRRKAFATFKYVHFALLGLTLAATAAHTLVASGSPPRANLVKYLPVALILYAYDWSVRIYRSRKQSEIVFMEALAGGVTRLVVRPPKGFVHTAGQYCFLQFPARSLIPHPFSISSPPYRMMRADPDKYSGTARESESGTITFHIKNMGPKTLTSWLFHQALASSSSGSAYPKVNLDGPYGAPPRLTAYSSVLLLAGGVGITPIISTFLSLMHYAREGHLDEDVNRLKRVHIAWCVREPECLTWFARELSEWAPGIAMAGEADELVAEINGVRFTFGFYATGSNRDKSKQASIGLNNDSLTAPLVLSSETMRASVGDGNQSEFFDGAEEVAMPTFTAGRPDVPQLVIDLAAHNEEEHSAVFACGPDVMVDAAAREGMRHPNVTVHTETFYL